MIEICTSSKTIDTLNGLKDYRDKPIDKVAMEFTEVGKFGDVNMCRQERERKLIGKAA